MLPTPSEFPVITKQGRGSEARRRLSHGGVEHSTHTTIPTSKRATSWVKTKSSSTRSSYSSPSASSRCGRTIQLPRITSDYRGGPWAHVGQLGFITSSSLLRMMNRMRCGTCGSRRSLGRGVGLRTGCAELLGCWP
jgi:hypothetical protein